MSSSRVHDTCARRFSAEPRGPRCAVVFLHFPPECVRCHLQNARSTVTCFFLVRPSSPLLCLEYVQERTGLDCVVQLYDTGVLRRYMVNHHLQLRLSLQVARPPTRKRPTLVCSRVRSTIQHSSPLTESHRSLTVREDGGCVLISAASAQSPMCDCHNVLHML